MDFNYLAMYVGKAHIGWQPLVLTILALRLLFIILLCCKAPCKGCARWFLWLGLSCFCFLCVVFFFLLLQLGYLPKWQLELTKPSSVYRTTAEEGAGCPHSCIVYSSGGQLFFFFVRIATNWPHTLLKWLSNPLPLPSSADLLSASWPDPFAGPFLSCWMPQVDHPWVWEDDILSWQLCLQNSIVEPWLELQRTQGSPFKPPKTIWSCSRN